VDIITAWETTGGNNKIAEICERRLVVNSKNKNIIDLYRGIN
jgi:hypothetical protein